MIHAKDQAEAERFAEKAAPTLSMGGDQVTISNQVCARKTARSNGSTKIWFQDGGGKITIEDYHYTMTVKIPKVNALDLKAHYSGVSLEDLHGKVNLSFMDCKVRGGNVGVLDVEDFENKYEIETVGTLEADTKYSKFEIGSLSSEIDFDGFEARLEVKKLLSSVSVMRVKGKYLDVELVTESGLT